VEPIDANGKRLTMLSGPTLPRVAGRDAGGLSGRLYGRVLKDDVGQAPVPFWRADERRTEDTRLRPGGRDDLAFTLPPKGKSVRISLVYRHTWPEVATS